MVPLRPYPLSPPLVLISRMTLCSHYENHQQVAERGWPVLFYFHVALNMDTNLVPLSLVFFSCNSPAIPLASSHDYSKIITCSLFLKTTTIAQEINGQLHCKKRRRKCLYSMDRGPLLWIYQHWVLFQTRRLRMFPSREKHKIDCCSKNRSKYICYLYYLSTLAWWNPRSCKGHDWCLIK